MKAIILAGGRGERLRPLTDRTPKPMIIVAGKPILFHIIELFKKHHIFNFIFTLCYLPEVIIDYFGDGNKFGVSIKYTFDDSKKPLGTAGSVSLSKKDIDETFIVTSGDILRKLDIEAMINFHLQNKALATLNVYKRYGADPKSMIVFDKKQIIKKFIERPDLQHLTIDFVWANGSFYIFEPEIFDYIPSNKPSDFGKDIFPELLTRKKNLFAYPTDDYFVDIGTLEKLKRARKAWII